MKYDVFNIAELYKALYSQLNELEKIEETSQHRILIRMQQETENEITELNEKINNCNFDKLKIEEYLNSLENKDDTESELLDEINSNYRIINSNIKIYQFDLDSYSDCLNIINKRINFILPYINKYMFEKSENTLSNSESKIHLINKKIHFKFFIVDMIYIVVALNNNKIFTKSFNNLEIRNFFENHFREFGIEKQINKQTLKNDFGKANSEVHHKLTKNEILHGTNLGSLGNKTFSNYAKQIDLIRLIDFFEAILSTEKH